MSDETRPLPPLSLEHFAHFFKALYGYRPFQWLQRLAAQVCTDNWPKYITVPTSSGKTSVIDIAIFALAYRADAANRRAGQQLAPRRIFFVVDRRIIVNEAFRRARTAAEKLRNVLDPDFADDMPTEDREVLTAVARWLQYIAVDPLAPPLDCFELRGGIYRDDAWIRSPLQPTVLTTTVDQVGSRLLFRGYGVSDRNLSIHAALTANDSLIILDEAHSSKPFSQTMEAIARYRGKPWAIDALDSPFCFVQMTATPPTGLEPSSLFSLLDDDYEADPLLKQRHVCCKPVTLVLAKGAKGAKLTATLAKKLVEQAESLSKTHGSRKIAVVVNRVALAREVLRLLETKHAGRASLMIGRMRPWDRDQLTTTLQADYGSGWTSRATETATEPNFVVATQCLEVGADLDFDGMVTQCASLDALRQRFGRLNRLGESPHARGVIVAAEGDIVPLEALDDAKPFDPIYGNAMARTWHWLRQQATTTSDAAGNEAIETIDFGVTFMESLMAGDSEQQRHLMAPAPNAPVLMPAHVDMFCQTSPRPHLDPDVALYLHGPNRGAPEIRVCWRADLDLSEISNSEPPPSVHDAWTKAIDLCPPSSAECLPVPLHIFRRWLDGGRIVDDTGDVLGESIDVSERDVVATDSLPHVLVWRGRRKSGDLTDGSFLATTRNAGDIRPNDTVAALSEKNCYSMKKALPSHCG